MKEMDSTKIKELKALPESFKEITLFHEDDRNYLKEINPSSIETTEWDKGKNEQKKIKSNIPEANKLQYCIYLLAKELKDNEFNTYIPMDSSPKQRACNERLKSRKT